MVFVQVAPDLLAQRAGNFDNVDIAPPGLRVEERLFFLLRQALPGRGAVAFRIVAVVIVAPMGKGRLQVSSDAGEVAEERFAKPLIQLGAEVSVAGCEAQR